MTSPWLVMGLIEKNRKAETVQHKETLRMKSYLTNWQTSITGLVVIFMGLWKIFTGNPIPGFDMDPGAAIVLGLGMLQAKDGAVTGGSVAATVEAGRRVGLFFFALLVGLAYVNSPSQAADLQPVPVVRKAMAPVQSWSGFYFGINGSGAKMSGKAAIPGDVAAVNPAGAMAGVMAGYGGWMASGAYVGVEVGGDYDFSAANTCLIVDCKIKSGTNLSQRLVIGMTLPQLMSKAQARGVSTPSQWPVPLSLPADFSASSAIPYLAVGLAERQTQACAIDCERNWLLGWQVGGGIKAPTSSGVTLDIGYTYTNWMKNRQFDVGVPVDIKALGEHKMTAGVQFHM